MEIQPLFAVSFRRECLAESAVDNEQQRDLAHPGVTPCLGRGGTTLALDKESPDELSEEERDDHGQEEAGDDGGGRDGRFNSYLQYKRIKNILQNCMFGLYQL